MLFKNRDLTLVVIARFVARLGGEAAFLIGIWGTAAYRFHATSTQIALLMAVLAISMMVGSAISGVLVDRYGPRNVLIAAQVVYVPIALTVPHMAAISQLIAACSLFGLATAPIMTATGSFAPYLAGDGDLARVNGTIDGAGAVSFILGPALGALASKAFGLPSVFYLDAALTTIGMLLITPVSTPPRVREGGSHPFRELVDGVKVVYGMRAVRYYVLMGTLVWFSFGAFGALEALFYRDVVKTGIEMVGYMNSLFGTGIAVGAFLLTRVSARVTSARGLAIGATLMGLGAVAYVGTTRIVVIGAGALLWGLIIGGVEPLLRTLMQLDSPEEYVGRVMGTAQLHRSAGEVVPLAFAPTLSAIFGVQAVLIGGGVLAAVGALCTLPLAASIDRAGHRPRGPISAAEAFATDDPISPLT
jgi:MFS family permease